MSKVLWVIAGLAGVGVIAYLVKRGQDEDGGGVAGDLWQGVAGKPSTPGSLSNLLGSGLYFIGFGSNPYPSGVDVNRNVYDQTASETDKQMQALVDKHNGGQLLTGPDLDNMGTWLSISSQQNTALWYSVKMIWDWYHAESTITD